MKLDVVQLTSMKKMLGHPDYAAGKNGDTDAAYRLIRDTIVKKEHERKIQSLKERYPNAILVAVHAEERQGINKIPQVLANFISVKTGLKINGGEDAIVQSVQVCRSYTDALYRLALRPKFTGRVENGDYIIVDDVITAGGTLQELRCYIESNGGNVAKMVVLAAAQFSTNINLSAKTEKQLLEKYDIMKLGSFLREVDIYDGEAGYITEAEGREILRFKNLDSGRDRIIEKRFERDEQEICGTLGKR